nr:hypothetical protein [Candidatus Gracilibacteria bacterium]
MKNNKKAFSLIVAMFLILVTSLLALYLLEYIIPFARNTEGMENGTRAYYESNKGVESTLFAMKKNDAYFETGKTMPTTSTGYSFKLISTGSLIPKIGEGNSDYNIDFNKIGPGIPVQLFLKGSINWNNVKFYFKVPDLDNNPTTNEVFSGGTAPVINWQLSSEKDTLNSTGSYVIYDNINDSTGTINSINFSGKDGLILSGTTETFTYFYNDSVNKCVASGCILKLSVVNELKTNNGKKIPYLEYKIDFTTAGPGSNPINVANYYSKITTSGKSTGYRKDLELDIPQQTTIESFDFTVFQ